MGLFPELSKFFVSYGQYHNDMVNKLIHIVCIPAIIFTAANMLQFTPWYMNFDGSENQTLLTMNLPMLVMFIPCVLYLNVEAVSGLISTVVYSLSYFYGRSLYLVAVENGTTSDFWNVNLAIQIVGWVGQFVGHAVFEGRKPALMDNLLLMLVAPDFVIIEILFALGWKKEMHAKCQTEIDQILADIRKEKAPKAK
jgi:uncharacterized membrane protein YGL010W